MKVLAIDFGEKRLGFAYSQGFFAEPLGTVSRVGAVGYIDDFCKKHDVKIIVIGMPEGKIAEKVRAFAKALKESFGVKIIFWDETLTSQKAVKILVANKATRKNRRKKEHEVAAALILQSFLDDHDKKTQT